MNNPETLATLGTLGTHETLAQDENKQTNKR